MDTFGLRLRKAREARGYSQNAFAKLLGISQPALALLEKSDRKTSQHILKMAYLLHVDAEWLQSGKGNPQSSKNTHLSQGFVYILPLDKIEDWLSLDKRDFLMRYEKQIVSRQYKYKYIGIDGLSEKIFAFDVKDKTYVVEPTWKRKTDDIVAVKLRNTENQEIGEVYKVTQSGGKEYLEPLDRTYPPVEFDKNIHKILGIVIEVAHHLISSNDERFPAQSKRKH